MLTGSTVDRKAVMNSLSRSLSTTTTLVALALGLAFVAPPVHAEDTDVPADVDGDTAKSAIKRFESSYDTVDIDMQLRALRNFGKVQHPDVAKELLKLLKKEESEHLLAAVCDALGKQLTSAKKAGPKLQKLLKDSETPPRVLAAAVRAVGALDYRKADDELDSLAMHDDDEVSIAVFRTFGEWKSEDHLEVMQKFFDKWPDEKGFTAISVTVDTGTAGSADQKAAQAKGKSKQAAAAAWKPRPEVTAVLRESLKQITGKGFRRPEDLREYRENPKKYRDPELVSERVDEAKRKALFKELDALSDDALAKAMEEAPGDDEGSRRSKLYYGIWWEERAKLADREELTISELIVIIEEGEEQEWPAN